ncbi:MAG: hypothetical protein VKL39_23235 [Leptolyngbyaceae bacterium]|nr:hypothetical protein [Leptolyngbyaceae bacterium]
MRQAILAVMHIASECGQWGQTRRDSEAHERSPQIQTVMRYGDDPIDYYVREVSARCHTGLISDVILRTWNIKMRGDRPHGRDYIGIGLHWYRITWLSDHLRIDPPLGLRLGTIQLTPSVDTTS